MRSLDSTGTQPRFKRHSWPHRRRREPRRESRRRLKYQRVNAHRDAAQFNGVVSARPARHAWKQSYVAAVRIQRSSILSCRPDSEEMSSPSISRSEGFFLAHPGEARARHGRGDSDSPLRDVQKQQQIRLFASRRRCEKPVGRSASLRDGGSRRGAKRLGRAIEGS